MIDLRYIVTGTGRSGTVSLACALSSAGLYCSHERFFHGNSLTNALHLLETNRGGNSWCSGESGLAEWGDKVVAESSYLAAPFLSDPYFATKTVIHAVRNPWKVILSFVNDIQFFRGEPEHEHELFIYSVLPELHKIRSPLDRAVYYYIHWNEMIERLARKHEPGRYIFHRVEDGPESLLRQLGVPRDAILDCPRKKDINSFKDWQRGRDMVPAPPRFTAEQMDESEYAVELFEIARTYGYERPSEPNDDRATSPAETILPENDWDWRFTAIPYVVELGYRGFNLVRWQRNCYAVFQALGTMDLSTVPESIIENYEKQGMLVVGRSPHEVKKKIDEIVVRQFESSQEPFLLECGYRGFNLVRWRKKCYAVHQELGPMDLTCLPKNILEAQVDRGAILVADSPGSAKKKLESRRARQVEGCKTPLMMESGYKGFNLVLWRWDYYAFDQALGPMDLNSTSESFLLEKMDRQEILVGRTLPELKDTVDALADQTCFAYRQ